ncbi:MAG: phosphoadenylyl-sulfate reductase [Pseudomonadota bacterium]
MSSTHLTDCMIEDVLETIDTAYRRHDGALVLTTSFGIHSALMLDLASRAMPGIGVVWVDTGYLPEETHAFASELEERFPIDLRVARSELSPEAFEARHGRPWETGRAEDLALYHRVRKVEPMKRALDRLGAKATLAGLRRSQTDHRKKLSPVSEHWGRSKYLPVLDWTERAVMTYLNRRDLPMHPLFYEGYSTVGDWHSSRPHDAGEDARATRFGGVAQECGLHLAG